jgi:hypothetical protein
VQCIVCLSPKIVSGLFADGDDPVGTAAAGPVFGPVHGHVEPVVELGVAQKNEIVHGDHLLGSHGQAMGDLVGETVKDVQVVASCFPAQEKTSPRGVEHPGQGVLGGSDMKMRFFPDAIGPVGTSGRVQKIIVLRKIGQQQAHGRPAVGAETRGVEKIAFGVESDVHDR